MFHGGDDFIKYNFNIPITYTQHIFTSVYEKTRLPVAVIFITSAPFLYRSRTAFLASSTPLMTPSWFSIEFGKNLN